MKLVILAIGEHPDDVELGCGGTLAKEISLGKKVGIIDLTKGELGTRGTDITRKEEAAHAAEILGIAVRENLDLGDGFFMNEKEAQFKVIEVIRKYQPDVIISNAPSDRHPDHAKGSELVNNAIFLSGLPKIENGLVPWRPKKHFHYIQWLPLEPSFVVDITGFLGKKVESCLAYKTQFFDPNSEEPLTPIATKNFTDSIEYRAMDLGRLIGTEAGEGFISRNYIAVNNLDSLL